MLAIDASVTGRGRSIRYEVPTQQQRLRGGSGRIGEAATQLWATVVGATRRPPTGISSVGEAAPGKRRAVSGVDIGGED